MNRYPIPKSIWIKMAITILITLVLLIVVSVDLVHGQITRPIINEVTPQDAVIDQYITIAGSGFGQPDNTNYTQYGLIFTNTDSRLSCRFGSVKAWLWTNDRIEFKLDHRSSCLHYGTSYLIEIDNQGTRSNQFSYQTGFAKIFIPSLLH